MKKLLKTAFALFFVLTICFPELIVVPAEAHWPKKVIIKTTPQGRAKAVITKQDIVQFPQKKRLKLRELELKQKVARAEKEAARAKEELARTKEELARARKAEHMAMFMPEVQALISKVQFMVVCPTPYEFLSVYKSLSASVDFWECGDVSSDIIDKLKEELYNHNDKNVWIDFLKEQAPASLSEIPFQPICFFRSVSNEILCLAWSGKGFESATSFGSKSKIFRNLEHVFICGICGCANREIGSGTLLFSTEYVTLSGNEGEPPARIPAGKKIYIQGRNSYFTNPRFFSCDTGKSFFRDLKRECSIDFGLALNFSFDFFVEDSVLAQSIAFRALQRKLVGCIDMEGVPLAKQFHGRNCTVHSLRVVSDHAGPRTARFSTPTGKALALGVLYEKSAPIITYWVNYWRNYETLEHPEKDIVTVDYLIGSPIEKSPAPPPFKVVIRRSCEGLPLPEIPFSAPVTPVGTPQLRNP